MSAYKYLTMNYHLKIKNGSFLNESLCSYGMLVQNYGDLLIRADNEFQLPYMWVAEGTVFPPDEHQPIKSNNNVRVFKKDRLILEKISNHEDQIINLTSNAFDLHDTDDKAFIDSLLIEWDTTDKIYYKNTEELRVVQKFDCVVGLASGSFLREIALTANANHIIFYDYKDKALSFQKELIESSNRKEVYLKYLDTLTTGTRPVTIEDIEKIDYDRLNELYDNLKNKKVEYILADLRTKSSIKDFVNQLPNNSLLWVSNLFTYITSMYVFNTDNFKVLEDSCTSKNITLLPYTKIIYESKSNI
jgi:hypothetical protein